MNHQNELPLLAQTATRRQVLVGAAAGFLLVTSASSPAWTADDTEGLSHSAETIHQERVFRADRTRIYKALTNAGEFDKVVQLSAAKQSGQLGNTPTKIGSEVGETFTLFGGHIIGRHLDLIPSQRIIQAWRVQSWKPGEYSIVRFELVEQGSDTKIVFDHKAFPEGQGQHLAAGWKANYWEPLDKFLRAPTN